MEKENQLNLAEIGKAAKVAFLKKLQSGKYKLGEAKGEQTELTFSRQESGQYKCDQTGEEKTKLEIESMGTGFFLLIEKVSDLKQEPEGYELINFQCSNCLESLLQPLN